MPCAAQAASDLGNQQGGVHAVLVAHEGAGQEAVALLEAEEERVSARVLELLNLLADELEARQRLEHLHAEGRGRCVLRQRRWRRWTSPPRRSSGSVPCSLLGWRGCSAAARSRSGCRSAAAKSPSPVLHGDAQTVAVRVGAEDHVRAHLVRQLDGQRERAGVLGVGHLHGGEVAGRAAPAP